jgi:hypothetical protein
MYIIIYKINYIQKKKCNKFFRRLTNILFYVSKFLNIFPESSEERRFKHTFSILCFSYIHSKNHIKIKIYELFKMWIVLSK